MKENDRQTYFQITDLFKNSDDKDRSRNPNLNLSLEAHKASNLKLPDCLNNQVKKSQANQEKYLEDSGLQEQSKQYGNYYSMPVGFDNLSLSLIEDLSNPFQSKMNLEETKFFSSGQIMLDFELNLVEAPIRPDCLELELPGLQSNSGFFLKKKYVSKRRKENPVKKLIRLIETEKINPYDNTELLNKFINQEQIDEIIAEEPATTSLIFTTSSATEAGQSRPCCTCQKSYCIKIYCGCFKNRRFCNNCSCRGCLNRSNFSYIRNQAIKHLEWKYDSVRVPISDCLRDSNLKNDIKKVNGCKCKQSNCRKNYCICFQNDKGCSKLCRCTNCFNV